MTSSTRGLRAGVLVGIAALALVGAACGSSKKSNNNSSNTTAAPSGSSGSTANSGSTGATNPAIKGKTVTLLGPETGAEADGVTNGLKPWADANGVKIEYSGTRDAETQVRTAAQAGGSALPDIFFAPQPGLVKDLAPKITPVPDDIVASMQKDYDPYFTQLATINGKVMGVPVKSDLKSLVWYSPKVFAQHGYQIPQTWDELIALQNKMKADGITPWCVGIESGDATGWPLTDWMEDIMLRKYGPDVYDQWVTHQIPFNDPKVKDVAQTVADIWFTNGNVLGGRQSIASTGFANAGLPVADGKCGMHRQANFYGVQFQTANPNVKFGSDGDINVFYLPTMSDKFGKITEVAGVYAVAFNSKPETLATLKQLETAQYAETRAQAQKSGYLSANKNVDVTKYGNPLDQQMAKILIAASPVRFDGSDAMPSKVGSGSFWKEGTNWVSGTESIDQFLNNVEASWPKS